MSPNVKAAMREWNMRAAMEGLEVWALERAGEITSATVPQASPGDTRNMLYELPAGLKSRLTFEVAWALQEERARMKGRIAELEESAEMACIQPDPDCGCPGCLYTLEKMREAGDVG